MKSLDTAIRIILLSLSVALVNPRATAQQENSFNHFSFNPQTINPAYAGTWDATGFLIMGQNQWAGLDGAPRSYALSMQTPFRQKGVGLGLNIISDRIGLEKRLHINADYSYRLKIKEEVFLRLGLKAGVTNYANDLSSYRLHPDDPFDPSFIGNIDVKMMPNFGVGAFLYSERYYVGLSIPYMLQNEFRDNYNNFSTQAQMRHFYLQGAYTFDLVPLVRFKPGAMIRATAGAPIDIDLSGHFLLADKIWIGANYSHKSRAGASLQWIIDSHMRLGYSALFDNTHMKAFHSGTHEITISYELGKSKRTATLPRFF